MWLRELLLASGEWDWSAMELRAEGEVCGVEWMFGDRGSVCGCGGLLLPRQSPPERFGVHSAVRRTGAHAPGVKGPQGPLEEEPESYHGSW